MKCPHCQKELCFPNTQKEYVWHLNFLKKILNGETRIDAKLEDRDYIVLALRSINSVLDEMKAVS